VSWQVIKSDCLSALKTFNDESVHSIITDPPYGLGSEPTPEQLIAFISGDDVRLNDKDFMGKDWSIPSVAVWKECFRVLKPGGHLLVFGGSRTFDLMSLGIRTAGFEYRDTVMWIYGCLSEDTEILVDGEWVPYFKAVKGRHALCYDRESNSYSWEKINNLYVYEYNDIAYKITSDSTDQLVTKNHRCLVEQNGNFEFKEAWEAALDAETRVPVLEGLSELLNCIPLPDKRAGFEEKGVLDTMCGPLNFKSKEREIQNPSKSLCNLQEILPCVHQQETSLEQKILQQQVQNNLEEKESTLMGSPLQGGASGQKRMDSGINGVLQIKNEWQQKPCMEGRDYEVESQRQLQECCFGSVSAGVSQDGSTERVCIGAQVNSSKTDQKSIDTKRSCSPHGSQSAKQCSYEFSIVQDKQRSQTVRASWKTAASLARFEEIEYSGIVWCISVPTGAFVARRNGKIFVTGNSGFNKGGDISKKIDKSLGVEPTVIGENPNHRPLSGVSYEGIYAGGNTGSKYVTAATSDEAKVWEGWGVSIKPAHEPIVMARKPFKGALFKNVLKHGTGAVNIDACRIPTEDKLTRKLGKTTESDAGWKSVNRSEIAGKDGGRVPANVILDEEVGEILDSQESKSKPARFFYCAKASKSEKNEAGPNNHPTVKPVDLMQWLVRLVTPPGGVILDPYAGSGTTGVAAVSEGFSFIGIEKCQEYVDIARQRIEHIEFENRE